jgi:hypothetical protein
VPDSTAQLCENRIDAALRPLGGAERSAVVEVGAPIPVAVPRHLEVARQPLALRSPATRVVEIAAQASDRGEFREDPREEPAQPHALSAAKMTDAVHAVVPVSGADQRQPVRSAGDGSVDGARAVLVQRAALRAGHRQSVRVELALREWGRLQERDALLEHLRVSAATEVVRGDERKPQEIVGATAANTLARGLVPPVLDVAFQELTPRRSQQMLAHEIRS